MASTVAVVIGAAEAGAVAVTTVAADSADAVSRDVDLLDVAGLPVAEQ